MNSNKGRSLILSIGVDRYNSASVPSLRWCADDAREFHSTMIGGRDPSYVDAQILLNEAATLDAIRYAIGDWLATTATAVDNVTVFYAGHGARETRGDDVRDVEGFLLPSDVSIDRLYSTALSLASELPVLLRRIRARNIVFVLDCCLSGSATIDEPGVRRRGINGPRYDQAAALSEIPLNVAVRIPSGEAEVGTGVAVLMACGPNEAALERDDLGHGIFTYHILDLIQEQRKIDTNSVGVGTFYSAVARRVRDATDFRQIPMFDGRMSDQEIFFGPSL